MSLNPEGLKDLVERAEISKQSVNKTMTDTALASEIDAESAVMESRKMAGAISGAVGKCPQCSPEPCDCDRELSGPGTQSILPLEAQSDGNLYETEAFKGWKAAQGKTPKLKRKSMTTTSVQEEVKEEKKRAGGLPSNPEPITAWAPEFSEEEVLETPPLPAVGGPAGPSAHQAFRQQKAEEDEAAEEEIDPLDYIQTNFEGAPSNGEIELWRQRHGDVFVTLLTDDEVFIWRTIKRLEYKNVMSMVATAGLAMAKTQNAAANADEGRNALFIEEIAKKCVLWPQIDQNQLTFSKAGTMDALANLILEASNFIPHSLAMRLTRKI